MADLIFSRRLRAGFVILISAISASNLSAADFRRTSPRIEAMKTLNEETLLISDTIPQPAPDEKIFEIQSIDRLPEFKGGIAGWVKYLQNNLRYPSVARDRGITGKVIMRFVVEKDGTLTDIQVMSSPDELLSREATRVVSKSPKWIPGIQEGRPVRVMYTLPIGFNLGARPVRP